MPEHPKPTPVALPTAPVAPAIPDEPQPDPLAVQVAGAVQRLRREAGLSERAAARRLGTSQTQLRRMEDPRYLPSLRSLARVAASYGKGISVEFTALVAEKKRPLAGLAARPKVPPRISAPAKAEASRRGRSRAVSKGRAARG